MEKALEERQILNMCHTFRRTWNYIQEVMKHMRCHQMEVSMQRLLILNITVFEQLRSHQNWNPSYLSCFSTPLKVSTWTKVYIKLKKLSYSAFLVDCPKIIIAASTFDFDNGHFSFKFSLNFHSKFYWKWGAKTVKKLQMRVLNEKSPMFRFVTIQI